MTSRSPIMESVVSSAEGILRELDTATPSEDRERILRYFRNYSVLDEGWADHSSSLILLGLRGGGRLRAQLHAPADLSRLPLIVRRGTTTPTMYGHPLGLQQ